MSNARRKFTELSRNLRNSMRFERAARKINRLQFGAKEGIVLVEFAIWE